MLTLVLTLAFTIPSDTSCIWNRSIEPGDVVIGLGFAIFLLHRVLTHPDPIEKLAMGLPGQARPGAGRQRHSMRSPVPKFGALPHQRGDVGAACGDAQTGRRAPISMTWGRTRPCRRQRSEEVSRCRSRPRPRRISGRT